MAEKKATIWRVKFNEETLWLPTAVQATKAVNERMRALAAKGGEQRAAVMIEEFERPTTAVGLCSMLSGDVAEFAITEDEQGNLFESDE